MRVSTITPGSYAYLSARLKTLSLLLLVATVFHAGLSVAANTNQPTISFTSAWQTAQNNSDFLASKRAMVEHAQFKQDSLRGLSFPRVDLTGTYTHLDDTVELDLLDFNPLTGLENNPIGEGLIDLLGGPQAFRTDIIDQNFGRVALEAIWPVYTGGRVTAVRDASAAQTDVAKQQQEIQKRTLFEELVRAYFGVSLARQNLQIHHDLEHDLGLHLENALKLEQQGQIAKVERLSVAAVYERTRVATVKAESMLEVARLTLAEILLQEPASEPADTLFINDSLPAEEDFLAATLSNSPLLKELNAHDRQADALIRAEKGRFHPEVFLFADWEIYKDNSIAFQYIPDWQVGVGINFTLLDRIGRSKSIDAALKTRESVTRITQGTKRFLNLAESVAYREANQALVQYAGLDASLALARENRHLRNKAFIEGFSTSVELTDAELFVSAVRIQQSAAAYAYIVSLARLLALTGAVDSFAEYQLRGNQLSFNKRTTP